MPTCIVVSAEKSSVTLFVTIDVVCLIGMCEVGILAWPILYMWHRSEGQRQSHEYTGTHRHIYTGTHTKAQKHTGTHTHAHTHRHIHTGTRTHTHSHTHTRARARAHIRKQHTLSYTHAVTQGTHIGAMATTPCSCSCTRVLNWEMSSVLLNSWQICLYSWKMGNVVWRARREEGIIHIHIFVRFLLICTV